MADLADLRNLQQNIGADVQPCTDRKRRQINAFGRQIFGEIAVLNVKAFGSDFFNAFFGQKTDLPDDIGLGMGVIFQPQIF